MIHYKTSLSDATITSIPTLRNKPVKRKSRRNSFYIAVVVGILTGLILIWLKPIN